MVPSLAQSSLTGVYLIEEDRFRYVNPAMARMFGYTVEEVVDRLGPADLVSPDDRHTVAENIRKRLKVRWKKFAITYAVGAKTVRCSLLKYMAAGLITAARWA